MKEGVSKGIKNLVQGEAKEKTGIGATKTMLK